MKRTARITGYQFVCFLKYLGIRAKIEDYERALCLLSIAVLGGGKGLHQGWDSHHQIQKTDMEMHPLLITPHGLLGKLNLLHGTHPYGQQIYRKA